MKIGLWNIDHPEKNLKRSGRIKRFTEITRYIEKQDCDFLILSEANSAIQVNGYSQYFSEESPFYNKNRCYHHPNQYHQVAIFSKNPCEQIAIPEPINGVLCKIEHKNQPIFIYGNVITIKDQWKKDSNKKYKDRLSEQISQFTQLLGKTFIIGGDFNLKKGWLQKRTAYNHVVNFVKDNNLNWPTSEQTNSVQHVIHSDSLTVTAIEIDASVQHEKGKKKSLSDHPFFTIDIS